MLPNTITKITKQEPKEVQLPDGIYFGIWSGYSIEMKYANASYQLATNEGVRGIGIKVVIMIEGGKATFSEIKN